MPENDSKQKGEERKRKRKRKSGDHIIGRAFTVWAFLEWNERKWGGKG